MGQGTLRSYFTFRVGTDHQSSQCGHSKVPFCPAETSLGANAIFNLDTPAGNKGLLLFILLCGKAIIVC